MSLELSKQTKIIYLSERLRIERYPRSRFWAVYLDNELLTLTVYKKGAIALCDVLLQYEQATNS